MTWTLEKIQAMIAEGREENLNLDYKASPALLNNKELAKDVSAFANSDGGVIIYGVEEEGHKPLRIDKGTNPAQKSKESIENTLIDSIRPRVSGIGIYPIDLPTGNQLFVVEIPKSNDAPHMAKHSYYKRYNFQSVPMEHYEVLDVMNRQSGPSLDLKFKLHIPNETTHWTSTEHFTLNRFCVQLPIINRSPTPASHIILSLLVDSRLELLLPPRRDGVQIKADSDQEFNVTQLGLPNNHVNWYDKYTFSLSPQVPVFGEEEYHFYWLQQKTESILAKFREDIKSNSPRDYYIYWTIQAPSMSIKHGLEKITYDYIRFNLTHSTVIKGSNKNE